MRTKAVLPVAGTAAVVTALAVTVALVGPDGHHSPRPLRLAAGGVASGVARDAAVAPGTAGGSGYTLTGALPAGRPADSPAYTLAKGPADRDVVAALARALKAGTPVHGTDGWRAGGLLVSDEAGQSWWWSSCAPDTPVAGGERVACAVASGGGVATAAPPPAPAVAPSAGSSGGIATAAPPPLPMPKDEVRTAAAPVLASLGLDVADARVDAWPYGGSVTVERTVGGFEAYGMQTTVTVDQDGKVSGANGYLGTPDQGDGYPLVTAQEAYDGLPPTVRDMMCPVTPEGKGCLPPQPTEVTGARLGLMVSGLVERGLALVPAWLFEVKGWTEPLPVVAVQARYLPSPEPVASKDPGTAPGSTGPVSTEPVPPVKAAAPGQPPAASEPGSPGTG